MKAAVYSPFLQLLAKKIKLEFLVWRTVKPLITRQEVINGFRLFFSIQLNLILYSFILR